MPTVDEQLAAVEARVEGIADLRREFAELRSDMNARFADVNARITELRGDMNGRFDEVNGRIGALEGKVDRQFIWLMGMMVTGFIAAIGALVGVR